MREVLPSLQNAMPMAAHGSEASFLQSHRAIWLACACVQCACGMPPQATVSHTMQVNTVQEGRGESPQVCSEMISAVPCCLMCVCKGSVCVQVCVVVSVQVGYMLLPSSFCHTAQA